MVDVKSRRRLEMPPTIGDTLRALDVLMPWKAEVDEPLAVEEPCRLLQQRNPPPVSFDQVIVASEDVGHPLLYRQLRDGKLD